MISGLVKSHPDHLIGYSDHTTPDPKMSTLTAAYIMGARIIEKHFTYDKSLPGNDHYHAMDKEDLRVFLANVEHLAPGLGDEDKAPVDGEYVARKHARRSIVTARSIKKGDVFSEAILTYKRPGTGISPLLWDEVIGSVANCDLKPDHMLDWSEIQKHPAGRS